MNICPICHQPLNETQWKKEKQYKSCPCCSQNAKIHIFYKYPEAFGNTPLRATTNNPDGPQSYCENCRGGNKGPHPDGLKCDEI